MNSEILNSQNKTGGILFKYAQLIVNIPNLGVKTFSYSIPDELRQVIRIGQPVLVSFGNKGIVNAFVVGFSDYLPEGIKAKSILEVLDEDSLFNIDYLNFLQWVGNYYCCPLQTVIETAVPMKFIKQSKNIVTLLDVDFNFDFSKEERLIIDVLKKNSNIITTNLQKKVKIVSSKFYSALHKLKNKGYIKVESEFKETSQKTKFDKFIKLISKNTDNKRFSAILEELEKYDEIELIKFEKAIHTTRKTLLKLVEEGFAEIFEKQNYRNPLEIYDISELEKFPELSFEQEQAFISIKNKIDEKKLEPVLLHGVTASGKTEVYFKAIQYILEQGKNVLFLAPEIALASELTRRLARRFGTEKVAIWHSSITDGEKFDIWQKLKKDEIKILAGARSAVFAPLKNIGLVIIDEEHENTYKQSTPAPRYNTKTVAEKLAILHNANLILGSATPDVSSYYNALNTNNLLTLKKRYNDVSMAKVVMIDMRMEKSNGNYGLFSRTLEIAINKNLEEKKQTILLVNRRGFATSTQCEGCGEVIKCPNCAIPMIWHASQNILKCHYCDYTSSMPDICPKCGSKALKMTGVGIEKVETIAKKIFPTAKIARLDSDVISQKNSCANILNQFSKGEIDVLLGTQMVAKGLDNPNVTIVGVINADLSFNFPDFRSSERGFQLLTQVAGRAGRGEFSGKVYFQTQNPEFYVLETARNQDYSSFYKSEIEAREFFDYPPFSQIITLVLSASESWRAKKCATEIAEKLREIIEKKGISEYIIVLGASPCILERIRGEYRFQVIIKNKLSEKGHHFITSFIKKIVLPNDLKMVVDIEPLDIL